MKEAKPYDLAKIDALVSERVMGVKPRISWVVSNDGGKTAVLSSDFFSVRPRTMLHQYLDARHAEGELLDCTIVKVTDSKPYSSDMSAAWEVVIKWTKADNKLVDTVDRNHVCFIIEKRRNNVVFGGDTKGGPTGAWDFDTPLCICLSALRAVGVSEEEIEACRE